jgi:hypothetical protein
MVEMTRREGLGLAAALGAAAASSAVQAEIPGPPLVTKIDFKDPKWNRDTFARLDADLDPTKEKLGWMRGTVYGVRDNEPVRPLFINEGFSFVRTARLPDGSWRRRLREIVFYRDIDTGEIMKEWKNPYTGRTVKVVPIANDPFNFTITEFQPEPPSYGGLNTVKPPKKPLLLDWSYGADDSIVLQTNINLYYPSKLQPDKWPMESPGVFSRVTELFIYVVKRKDIENPKITHLPHVGSWSRITPWLPWMQMGAGAGHITFFNTFGSMKSLSDLPKDLVEAARAVSPKYLSAPTTEYGPSLSSLENYALTEKPAPVPAGWTPPQPPSTPKALAPPSTAPKG